MQLNRASCDRERWFLWIALAGSVLICVFLSALAPATQLWDRDEPLYARTAVEMLRSGNWYLPTFNEEVFAHKPPLIYWLMAISAKIFGVNEFAFRFVSCVGLAISALFTFLIGRRLFDGRTALWAMAIFSTTAMSVYLGSAAMLDAVMLAWILLAFWSYVELIWANGSRIGFCLLFCVGLALSMLTKGPVGPAVVGSALLTTWALSSRSVRPGPELVALLAISAIVASGIFLLWAIPANALSGGAIVNTGFWTHVVGRFLAPMEGHGRGGIVGYLMTLPIYIPIILIGVMPWSVDLPETVAAVARGRLGGPAERAFLSGWALSTFVMFSLAATKLPHYVFPLFPPISMALAALHTTRLKNANASNGVWRRVGEYGYVLLMAAGVLALGTAALLFLELIDQLLAFLTAIGIAAAGFTFLRMRRNARFGIAQIMALISTPAFFLGLYWVVVPPFERDVKISRAIANSVAVHGDRSIPIFLAGYAEPSLIFYLDRSSARPVRSLPTDDVGLRDLVAASSEFIVVASEERYQHLKEVLGPSAHTLLSRHEALNLNAHARRQVIIVAAFGVP